MPPTVARRSATIVLPGGAAAVLGVASVAIAHHSPAFSFGGDSTAASAAELAAGWALTGAGLALWARRPSGGFGLVLAAAGLAWFLVEWNNAGIGSALLFTIGLVASAACPAVVGHAALAYPGAWPRAGVERWAVALAYAGAVIGLGVLPALSFDPPAQGCSDCPANLLSIGADPDASSTLSRTGIRFGVVWAGLLAVLAAWRLLRANPARRRVVAPVLAPAGAYLALVALDYVHGAGRGFLSNDRADRRLWLGEAGALVALAAGVAWARTRRHRTRSAIAGLVVELGTSPTPGGLRDVLAGLLGDSSLELVYARDGEPGWVDANGLAVAPARDGAVVTRLVAGERPLAALVHRPGLLDDPGLAHEIARAARLALEHERLQAETRAQLERLRGSRARDGAQRAFEGRDVSCAGADEPYAARARHPSGLGGLAAHARDGAGHELRARRPQNALRHVRSASRPAREGSPRTMSDGVT